MGWSVGCARCEHKVRDTQGHAHILTFVRCFGFVYGMNFLSMRLSSRQGRMAMARAVVFAIMVGLSVRDRGPVPVSDPLFWV